MKMYALQSFSRPETFFDLVGYLNGEFNGIELDGDCLSKEYKRVQYVQGKVGGKIVAFRVEEIDDESGVSMG